MRWAVAVISTLLLAAALMPAGTQAAVVPAGTTVPKAHQDAVEGVSPLDLVSVTFGQAGKIVRLQLTTARPFLSTVLAPGSGRSLCVLLNIDADAIGDQRLCAVSDATARSGLRLRVTRLDGQGKALSIVTLPTLVLRLSGREIRADVLPRSLGLKPGRYAWQARSRWRDDAACKPTGTDVSTCSDTLPDNGAIPFRLSPLKVVGCGFKGTAQFRRGSGDRIALTFDDGPAAITAEFLKVLERERVPATFFLVGQNVPGREGLLKRMLDDGDMIANHSLTHANLGGGGPGAGYELRRTQEIIRRATGFTPCLFRPPYGSTSASLVATAGAQRLTTVLWDVDPNDWRTPGVSSIQNTILAEAHAGSIVLSHDGGGPRSQTLAALPGVIHAFKRRGYEFVTVNEMLGLGVIRE